MKSLPVVSFIIVARNASQHLPQIFSNILAQDYPSDSLEILLIDGRSTDDTRNIMENFAGAHQEFNVRVLDNPGKILSCGWNVALAEAKGDIILRVDAHSSIPSDFISRNVGAILSGENIVGGATISKAHEGTWLGFLSLAEGSKFGSGVADFRNPGPSRYVDTLAHAAYKRSVFEKVGGYDERLVRNQDNEIHYRMKKAGFRFFFDPAIKSFHTPRSTLHGILKQKYGNGFWIGLTMGIQPRCFGVRHFVPALFVGALVVVFVLGIVWNWFPVIFLTASYGICAIVFTIEALLKAPLKIKALCLFLPFIFLLMHILYGVGTLVGLIKMPFFCLEDSWLRNTRIDQS
jgi:glycosyltransferase involved in cell wall biosynthesis